MTVVRMVGALMLMGGLCGAVLYTGVMFNLVRFVDREVLITWSVYAISVSLMLVVALLGYVALTAPTPQRRSQRELSRG
ncbi:MAG: hypothetical protein NZ957_01800 [Thaumarchaeota archaeon]|nr:hypothetical protein [Candidatus Calditenuaceae archaeon]MDW8041745.1 hypothetical protein [Nitrososphaerota archaeon]